MTPANVIAIVSIVALLLIQGLLAAFFMGKLSARVQNLEARPNDNDCKTELAALRATLDGFKEAIVGRVRGLEDLVRDLIHRPAA